MKKSILVINLLGMVSVLYANSLSRKEIVSMVNAIKKERSGVNIRILQSTPNPFAIYKKPEVKPKVIEAVVPEPPKEEEVVIEPFEHKLLAILNHAAFIDGKWYKIGDKLEAYTLVSMGEDQVVFKRGEEKRTLAIPKVKKKFILHKRD